MNGSNMIKLMNKTNNQNKNQKKKEGGERENVVLSTNQSLKRVNEKLNQKNIIIK